MDVELPQYLPIVEMPKRNPAPQVLADQSNLPRAVRQTRRSYASVALLICLTVGCRGEVDGLSSPDHVAETAVGASAKDEAIAAQIIRFAAPAT